MRARTSRTLRCGLITAAIAARSEFTDPADTSDAGIAVLLAETETRGETRVHDVAV